MCLTFPLAFVSCSEFGSIKVWFASHTLTHTFCFSAELACRGSNKNTDSLVPNGVSGTDGEWVTSGCSKLISAMSYFYLDRASAVFRYVGYYQHLFWKLSYKFDFLISSRLQHVFAMWETGLRKQCFELWRAIFEIVLEMCNGSTQWAHKSLAIIWWEEDRDD